MPTPKPMQRKFLTGPNGATGYSTEFGKCPKPNCPGEIIYNGNYFCSHWAYPYDPTDEISCDWAMPTDEETWSLSNKQIIESERVKYANGD